MSESEIAIRPLTPADIGAVVALWRAAGLPYRPTGRDHPDALSAQIATARGLFLGAVRHGELVGTAFGSVDGRQKGWINRVAVDPRFQRRGVAARLLAAVEARLVAAGALLITALIEGNNRASLSLFRACGYEEDRAVVYVRKRVVPGA